MVRLQLWVNGWLERAAAKGLHPTMVRLQQPTYIPALGFASSVSIPLWFDCNWYERDDVRGVCRSLHPTMVRLQHYEAKHSKLESQRSPSHYGSTATGGAFTRTCRIVTSPSHYGSTATGVVGQGPGPFPQISIPLWFDCNAESQPPGASGASYLHPTMIRLQLRVFSLSSPLPSHISIPLWFDCNTRRGWSESPG